MKLVVNGSPVEIAKKPASPLPENAVRSLAHNIFQQLRLEGCNTRDIISVSSQLISLVTSEIQKSSPTP